MSNLDERTLEAIKHGETQMKSGYGSGYLDAINHISAAICDSECATFSEALRRLNDVIANANNVIKNKYKLGEG